MALLPSLLSMTLCILLLNLWKISSIGSFEWWVGFTAFGIMGWWWEK